MTISWDEAKRRAEDTRRAAGHPVRTDADRAAGQQRLDDEIHAWRLAEVRRNRSSTQREVADVMGASGSGTVVRLFPHAPDGDPVSTLLWATGRGGSASP